MRMTRALGIVALAVGLVVGLTPSAAVALDDNENLTCTEWGSLVYTTYGPEGEVTHIEAWCDRWEWTPPTSEPREPSDREPGDAPPGSGGPSGPYTPPNVDCEQALEQYKQAQELFGAYEAEYQRAQAAFGRASSNFENQVENADQLYANLQTAKSNLGTWAYLYRAFNDEEPYFYVPDFQNSLVVATPLKFGGHSAHPFADEVTQAIEMYQRALDDFKAADGLAKYLDEVLTEEEKTFDRAREALRSVRQDIEVLETILTRYC